MTGRDLFLGVALVALGGAVFGFVLLLLAWFADALMAASVIEAWAGSSAEALAARAS